MTYQALYRVWRSQRFVDIVGQQTITQTLKNAIVQKQVSHAYLFTGPRGTGKTSAAKIFAKAINCLHPEDGEPCNQCQMCTAITAGNQEDVIEIDAASNNGVEEIRFIRDRANYAPTQAQYKIYIIDEVHMLSTGAFNALLKTLEEPKQNVIFILATTEPHKIPATIISRTQRFDFKRIQTEAISEHLSLVLGKEGISYETEAIQLIARAAEGGMRDALSILDQAISFSGEKITLADAMEVTGSLSYETMDELLYHCFHKEVAKSLSLLGTLLDEGKESRRLLENLLVYCRDLLVYQQAPRLIEDKNYTLTQQFKELAKAIPAQTIYDWIAIMNETQDQIRLTTSPTLYLEVAVVKMSENRNQIPVSTGLETANTTDEFESLKKMVESLQQEVESLKQNGTLQDETVAIVSPKKTTTKSATYRLPRERVFQVLKEATKADLDRLKLVWEDTLDALTPTQKAMLRASTVKAAGPHLALIAFDYEIICQRASADSQFSLQLSETIGKMTRTYQPDMVFIPAEEWPQLRQDFLNRDQGEFKEAAIDVEPQQEIVATDENQVVTKAKELFGDLATIIEEM